MAEFVTCIIDSSAMLCLSIMSASSNSDRKIMIEMMKIKKFLLYLNTLSVVT